MNNIEEQNMNDEPNPDVTGNMDAPTRAPSAKKVYSKPVLHVLMSTSDNEGRKTHTASPELRSPGMSASPS
jgi:hypothetical protein